MSVQTVFNKSTCLVIFIKRFLYLNLNGLNSVANLLSLLSNITCAALRERQKYQFNARHFEDISS